MEQNQQEDQEFSLLVAKDQLQLTKNMKAAPVKTAVIVLTEDIFTSERSYAGLRFALACAARGNPVHVVLFGKSIELALRKNTNNVLTDKKENRQLWLDEIQEAGGFIYACECYCHNHQIKQEDLLRYVPITKIGTLVEITNFSDIHLVF